MTEKLLATGKTHNTGGSDRGTRSSDGMLDAKFAHPHPAAENFFGAAWCACYVAALEHVASQKKISLVDAPYVDAEIDLLLDNGSWFLRARLNVSLKGVERDVARAIADGAHLVCPYSKAVHGNIDIETNLI